MAPEEKTSIYDNQWIGLIADLEIDLEAPKQDMNRCSRG